MCYLLFDVTRVTCKALNRAKGRGWKPLLCWCRRIFNAGAAELLSQRAVSCCEQRTSAQTAPAAPAAQQAQDVQFCKKVTVKILHRHNIMYGMNYDIFHLL